MLPFETGLVCILSCVLNEEFGSAFLPLIARQSYSLVIVSISFSWNPFKQPGIPFPFKTSSNFVPAGALGRFWLLDLD